MASLVQIEATIRMANEALGAGRLKEAADAAAGLVNRNTVKSAHAAAAAAVLHRIAAAFGEAGNWRYAERIAFSALMIRGEVLPGDHLDLAESFVGVGKCEYQSGKGPDLAAAYFEKALAILPVGERRLAVETGLANLRREINSSEPTTRLFWIDTLGASGNDWLAFIDRKTKLGLELMVGLRKPKRLGALLNKELRMRTTRPHPTLTSLIAGTGSLLVVEERLHQMLLREGAELEAICVVVEDSKGKILSRDYRLIHPIASHVCVANPEAALAVERLVVDDRADSAPPLFLMTEPEHLNGDFFVSEAMAKALNAGRFPNLFLMEAKHG